MTEIPYYCWTPNSEISRKTAVDMHQKKVDIKPGLDQRDELKPRLTEQIEHQSSRTKLRAA
jgi:hypothetical protein